MTIFYKAHESHDMAVHPLFDVPDMLRCRACGAWGVSTDVLRPCPFVGEGPHPSPEAFGAVGDVLIDGKGEPFGLARAPRDADGKAPGWKDDLEKNALHLIPTEAIDGLGHVLTFGARKYGDRNWEKGMAWSRCYGALLRHLNAWWGGEDEDAETGMSHLWHALCCLAFLTAYEARGAGTDDRPK